MVLFFGVFAPPVTGQSIAMKYAYNSYRGEKKIIKILNENKYFLGKFLNNLFIVFFKIPFFILYYKPQVVYISLSLNTFSSSRDIILILFAKLFKIKVIEHLQGYTFKSFVCRYPFLHNFYAYVYGKIDVFVFNFPPKTLDKDIFQRSAFAVYTYRNIFIL